MAHSLDLPEGCINVSRMGDDTIRSAVAKFNRHQRKRLRVAAEDTCLGPSLFDQIDVSWTSSHAQAAGQSVNLFQPPS